MVSSGRCDNAVWLEVGRNGVGMATIRSEIPVGGCWMKHAAEPFTVMSGVDGEGKKSGVEMRGGTSAETDGMGGKASDGSRTNRRLG